MSVSLLALITFGFLAAGPPERHATTPPPPALACYFLHEPDLTPEGYRPFLEDAARLGHFTHLTTSLRLSTGELTDDYIHAAITDLSAYANSLGIGIVMDLDLRLAREAFQARYPDELQEMLRVREVSRADDTPTLIELHPETPSDHYTYKTKPYLPVAGRLLRVYAFDRGAEGIDPDSLVDITPACRVEQQDAQGVRVQIPAAATPLPCIAAMAAFTHLTPDVYAPHLLAFQRELIQAYAQAGLAGACKDEWGFPPSFDGFAKHDDFWYSDAMARAYHERTGRDLVTDILLMYSAQRGQDAARCAAINAYTAMNRERHTAIEADFYDAVKSVFGPGALVATHPTWYPQLDRREIIKNGLDWWSARRNYAQTDEVTPFCVRTALAKKWGHGVWYNMYYSSQKHDYETSLWTHALAGGRINYHPLYPVEAQPPWNMKALYEGGLMQGEARVRLLNWISPAPLDCPVAVVFGHAAATNWAGPAYEDTGLDIASALWKAGYYADLIPTTEFESRALRVEDGQLAYGDQRYRAVVLYHPEFEDAALAAILQRIDPANTPVFVVGDWTRDAKGQPIAGNALLQDCTTRSPDNATCIAAVTARLKATLTPATPATAEIGWDQKSAALPPAGSVTLLDGTRLIVAGAQDPAGDPIHTTLEIDGHAIDFDATGLAAVRLGGEGRVTAMAAGGLRRFEGPGLHLQLAMPLDMALWRDADEMLQGVVYTELPIPQPLLELTPHWRCLAPPIAPEAAPRRPAAGPPTPP